MFRLIGKCILTSVSLALASAISAADFSQQSLNALLFAEVDYRERENTGNDGFYLGQVVGQINYAATDRLSFFSESTLTSRHNRALDFEVERLSARYDFSDHYKLSAGRYHTPLGYWNAAFHHGSWLQTTVDRPQTMRFGSSVVPIHFIGGLLEGNIAESSFSYRLGVGSGRSEDDLHDTPDASDAFDDSAYLLGITYRNQTGRRFEAGFTAYIDEPTSETGETVDEEIYNGYLVLLDEAPELILEYTHARHEAGSGKGSVRSIYAQAGYRLNDGASSFKPYFRIEDLHVDSDDPLLRFHDQNYEGISTGLRWDFSTFGAFKAEVRNEKFGNRERSNSIYFQVTFVQALSSQS